jgi:hypothetical protein
VPDEIPYNPLDVEHLGESVTESLLRRSVTPLASLAQFNGAGVYAIYYTGESPPFEPYEPLAQRNREEPFSRPIYVGKAVPSGARKGRRSASAVGPKLFGRLNEHAQSIHQATNLDLAAFHCRYLVVEDIWIPLGESLLIDSYQPLWNVIVEGFGNHPPGGGRKKQRRSMWDMIHPGRAWAEELPENDLSVDAIIQLIGKALAGAPVLTLSPEVQRQEADSDEDERQSPVES